MAVVVNEPAPRDKPLPAETVIQDNPANTPVQFGNQAEPTQSLVFNGSQYKFPGSASDEEMLQFISNLPADEEASTEEPPEPLREQQVISKDEGVRKDKDGNHIAYMDTEKHLTGGRGHLLTKDERKQYPKGTIIPNEVVDAWFKEDMNEADATLVRILEKKATHVPDEVYDILLNMSFNLGQKGLLSFKDMWAAIEIEDWATAAVEMEDSKWFKQVKNRAVRLVNRMAALAPAKDAEASAEEDLVLSAGLTPAKGGLFEDENGTLFIVDEQGNKKEV